MVGGDGRDVIPNSIKLIAGRTGQEFNQRKNRRGAFWEDRYHATAIQSGEHLFRCLVYIDLNMVRAGVVNHPSEWPFCGYNEIQEPKRNNPRKQGTPPIFHVSYHAPTWLLMPRPADDKCVGF